jgi:sugar O-acyltransferase (sialic acid O-acetyltransferase NeuD family)
MKQLIIIGARGMGREVFFHAQQSLGYGTEFVIKGFLDDKADALASYPGYAPILGPVENHEVGVHDVFICALGDVRYRKRYIELIRQRGGRLQSLIHPSAIIYPTSSIGTGCLIGANVHITADVRIGSCTTVFGFSSIGHDVRIGEYCHLGAYAFVGGFACLEDMVTLHPGAKVMPRKVVGTGATVGIGSVAIRSVKPGQTVFGLPALPIFE